MPSLNQSITVFIYKIVAFVICFVGANIYGEMKFLIEFIKKIPWSCIFLVVRCESIFVEIRYVILPPLINRSFYRLFLDRLNVSSTQIGSGSDGSFASSFFNSASTLIESIVKHPLSFFIKMSLPPRKPSGTLIFKKLILTPMLIKGSFGELHSFPSVGANKMSVFCCVIIDWSAQIEK